MTEEQKKQIKDLRMKGEGYKKIAQYIGLSENTVKSFCRRMNAAKPEAVKPQTADVGLSCECCGKTMAQIPGRKKRRFCSDACRQKWWNSHLHLVQRKAVYPLVCRHCGRIFEVYGNSRRKYCSHACYIAERFGGCKSARTKLSVAVRGDCP